MASFRKKGQKEETGALTPGADEAFKEGWKTKDLAERRRIVLSVLARFHFATAGSAPEDGDELSTPTPEEYESELFRNYPSVTWAEVLAESVWNLRYYIEEAKEVPWAEPMVELHYEVPWAFHEEELEEDEYEGVPVYSEPTEEDLETFDTAFKWVYHSWRTFTRYNALSYITHKVAVHATKDGSYSLLPPDLRDELDALADEEREDRLDVLFRPHVFVSAGGEWWRDFARSVGLPEDMEELPEGERPSPLSIVVTRKDEETGEEEKTRLNLFCAVFPLVVDREAEEAYFPVQVGFQVEGGDPSSWNDEDREAAWKTISENLSRMVEELRSEEPQQEELPGFESSGGVTIPGPTFSGYATVEPPAVESPTASLAKERSLKVPRRYSQGLIALSPEEALGPRYLSDDYPDLDPAHGGESLKEAKRLFFDRWAAHLEGVQETFPALTARPYLRHEVDGNAVYVFPGLEREHAELLWETFEKTLSGKAGGPGLEVVRRPGFERETESELVEGSYRAKKETRVYLWPAENVLEAMEPAVRFEGRKAPGYLGLLARQEGPYRDGSYLVLEKRGSEVYAVQPGGSLIRDLLERYKKDERILTAALQKVRRQQPSLFEEERTEQAARLREMEELLERLRERVEEASSYDCLDLHLEVWKAWDEQKDAWAQGLVRFPDGLEVRVGPVGAVVLGPDVLQQYAPGDNWRAAVYRKLRALSTFEYVVRDENGEEKEGANFVSSVVDGRREEAWSAGLAPHLAAVGRWPSDYFFVGVNALYVSQVSPWAFDEDGKVHWREDAIRVLEAKKRRDGFALKEARKERDAELRRLRKETYYQSLPDFTRWREAQGWSVLRKGLSEAVLVETTPQRRTPASLQGAGLVACNGGANRGYKLSTWKKKAHYTGHHWRRKLLEDLQALADSPLGLVIETDRYRVGTPAQVALEGLAAAPREDPTLRLYRRTDANERAREELQKGKPAKPAPLKRWHRAEQIPLHEQGRRARIDSGMGQKELAVLLGVNQSTVSRWEKGTQTIPAEVVERIRELLGDKLPEEKEDA